MERSKEVKHGVIHANKRTGETPLQCLERVRIEQGIQENVPMTYAGRLDPMAEGVLLILVGDECKNKEKYLGLDKEYEVEIVFGISTDTHDALGLVEKSQTPNHKPQINSKFQIAIEDYIGKFDQPYPSFSSKTVGGIQLHELARADALPDEMPTKEVEIYSIDLIASGKITAEELKSRILNNIALVKGDFRQEEIAKRWSEAFTEIGSGAFPVVKIKVRCSSGTYMRSLADRMGKDANTGAFALSIKRTGVGGIN